MSKPLLALYGALLLTMAHWELCILALPTEALRPFAWMVFFTQR